LRSNAEVIFVRLVIPLSIGIYYTYFQESNHTQLFLLITSSLFIVLLFINFNYKSLRAYRFKTLTGMLFLLFLLAFGGFIGLLNKEVLEQGYFTNYEAKQLKVWINDEPQRRNETIRFTVKVVGCYKNQKFHRTTGKLLIILKIDSLNPITYNYGDELLVNANYTPIAPPYNYAEFDFKGSLAAKNVYHQAFIEQIETLKTGHNLGNAIITYALNLRKSQIDHYNRIIKDQEAFAVASTLILGYRADLSEDTLSIYSKTGTIHALSVSGMHVGIIYLVLNWVLSFLNNKPSLRMIKIIVIISLIWFYSLVTGFSPSILRSAIMLTVYIFAKSFSKHSNGYNILAFTAFCLLIYEPYLIVDVGFQLSFLAVLGLIYLHPKIYKCLYFKQRWADWLWSSIAMSIAAQITTFPLSIYYFHQFPIYFILSNLFILLPISLLMYLGIAILLFKLYFLAPVLAWLILFMNGGLKWISDLPLSTISEIWLNKPELLTIILTLILVLLAIEKKNKYILGSAMLLCLYFNLSIAIRSVAVKQQKKILFFTLQKGYATAFINRQSAVIITNLTTKDKNFTFFIQPALDQLQIKNKHLIKWETDFHLESFSKKHHQIKFFNYRILMIDNCFNHKNIAYKPVFNMVWLHQNPKTKLVDLRKALSFEELVIDASNNTSHIKKYCDEAKKIQTLPHVLKKNKAYLVELNHFPQ
jgi:competence protein ComEC